VVIVVVALTNYCDLASFFVTNISAQNISDTKERFINPIFIGRASNMLTPIPSSFINNK
jgi:hypothetical protein